MVVMDRNEQGCGSEEPRHVPELMSSGGKYVWTTLIGSADVTELLVCYAVLGRKKREGNK